MPSLLNRSIMKDKNKKQFDANNFRPISVSNVFAQILEKVIFESCNNLLNTSNRQFGFKQNMLPLHPLFLVKELIHKNIKEETPLYI